MGNGLFDIEFTEKECGMALDYRELDVWKMSAAFAFHIGILVFS